MPEQKGPPAGYREVGREGTVMTSIAAEPSVRAGAHGVQFYGIEPSVLVQNVAAYVDEGLQRGDSVLVIATPEHGDATLSAVETRRGFRMRARQLVVLDAEATLERILVDGTVDRQRFEHVIGGTIRGLRDAKPNAGLRAYGEMVGLLWARGQVDAAVQLEQCWNDLLAGDDFRLLCGYPIDVFGDEFRSERVHAVLCAHSHVLPGGIAPAMESALDRSMREVLGDQSDGVHCNGAATANPAWPALSAVEATIIRLHAQQPQRAGEILARARSYYRACA
jgi:hypothetical protein